MDNREVAEVAFNEADRVNAKKNIDKLVRLASAYKMYMQQHNYAQDMLKQYKSLLKDSGFTHEDVISVITLTRRDSLNKYVIQEAGNIKEVEI